MCVSCLAQGKYDILKEKLLLQETLETNIMQLNLSKVFGQQNKIKIFNVNRVPFVTSKDIVFSPIPRRLGL